MKREISQDWAYGDLVSAERLQDYNRELDKIFQEIDLENASWEYDSEWKPIKLIDNTNNRILLYDYTNWSASPAIVYLWWTDQPKKYKVTYGSNGLPANIILVSI